jgi:hypothetical protein
LICTSGPLRFDRRCSVSEHLLADAGLAENQHVDAALGDLAQVLGGAREGRIFDPEEAADAAAHRGLAARRADDDERQATDVEGVADGQRLRRAAVMHAPGDARSVARIEILQHERRPDPQPRMPARQRWARHHDVAVLAAADDHVGADERVSGEQPLAGDQEQRRIRIRRPAVALRTFVPSPAHSHVLHLTQAAPHSHQLVGTGAAERFAPLPALRNRS